MGRIKGVISLAEKQRIILEAILKGKTRRHIARGDENIKNHNSQILKGV